MAGPEKALQIRCINKPLQKSKEGKVSVVFGGTLITTRDELQVAKFCIVLIDYTIFA